MCKIGLIFVSLTLISLTFDVTSAAPFLFNSGQSILTSLFSTSSGPAKDDSSNIEDLRGAKHEDRMDTTDEEEEGMNPSLIGRKIGKFLSKLQVFSQLRTALKPETARLVSDGDVETAGANELDGFGEFGEFEEATEKPDDAKIGLSPGSIGVYLSELFGSLATLIYGAALQISNSANVGNSTNTL